MPVAESFPISFTPLPSHLFTCAHKTYGFKWTLKQLMTNRYNYRHQYPHHHHILIRADLDSRLICSRQRPRQRQGNLMPKNKDAVVKRSAHTTNELTSLSVHKWLYRTQPCTMQQHRTLPLSQTYSAFWTCHLYRIVRIIRFGGGEVVLCRTRPQMGP